MDLTKQYWENIKKISDLQAQINIASEENKGIEKVWKSQKLETENEFVKTYYKEVDSVDEKAFLTRFPEKEAEFTKKSIDRVNLKKYIQEEALLDDKMKVFITTKKEFVVEVK